MLLTQNLTVSYGQIGDTLNCYTNQEMVKIVTRVVRAKECDTLLNIVNKKLDYNKDVITAMTGMLGSKDSIINLNREIVIYKEEIIVGLTIEIDSLRKNERRIKRREMFTRIGLVAVGVGLVAALLSK